MSRNRWSTPFSYQLPVSQSKHFINSASWNWAEYKETIWIGRRLTRLFFQAAEKKRGFFFPFFKKNECLLTIIGGVFPWGPVCLACPIGPPAGPIWPGLVWFSPMPMPCPWDDSCCWGPVPAGAPGCPGLAADVWACCWSWVFCPGPISDWGPVTLCRPDPVGPPAEPCPRVELLPDLEEPGWGRDLWF